MSEQKIKFVEKELSSILNESNQISNSIASFRIHSPYKKISTKINSYNDNWNNKYKKFNLNQYKANKNSTKKIILRKNLFSMNNYNSINNSNILKNSESFSNSKIDIKNNSIILPILKKNKSNINIIKLKDNNSKINKKSIKKILFKENNVFKEIENKIKNKHLAEKQKEKNLFKIKKNKIITRLFNENNKLFINNSITMTNKIRQNKLKYNIFRKYKEVKDMTNKIVLFNEFI